MRSLSVNTMERISKISAINSTTRRMPVNRNQLKSGQGSILLKDYDFTPEMQHVDPESSGTKTAAKIVLGSMAAGAAVGAAAGSFVPVVGTAAGATVGGYIGAGVGVIRLAINIFKGED